MSINNLAIDFGTCNTVISYKTDDNIMHILDNITNDTLISSTIFFIRDEITDNIKINDLEYNKHYVIGGLAKDVYNNKKDHESYFYQFKRFLGLTDKNIDYSKDFLDKFKLKYVFEDDTIYFFIPTNVDDISIKINIIDLTKLFFIGLYNLIKNTVSIVGDLNIIVTCPAYFHDLQRSQLKKSVEKAGFKVYKMYNEPTSAAIYYINKYIKEDSVDSTNNNKFIVYDLGGGTIDTTVVEYHVDSKICDIIDIDGNNSLGGIDIDNLIVEDIYNRYFIDRINMKCLSKIRKCAEEIKIKLSYTQSYEIIIENIPINKNNKIDIVDIISIKYTQHMLNSLINNMIDKMIEPIIKMYKKYDTQNIIFIGGPTQIPLLHNKVNSYLNISSNNIILNNHNNLYKTIVADGACIMYDFLNKKSDFCLLDIIPMNIGISSPDDNMINMITKNSKIPVTVERVFTTSHDCQRSIDIEIFEGVSEKYKDNTYIGSYKIIGIPPLSRGSIIIKLLFKISYNGILDISISGFKNPSDDSAKSFDYKLCEKIRLIPNLLAKELLKKLLNNKIMTD